jgi:fucose permease
VAVSALVVAGTTALLLAVGPRLSVAQRTSGERAALAALTRDPVLLRLAVVFAASFGLSVVVGNWVVTLLEKTAGLSSAQADVLGTATLVLASGSPPLGGLALPRHVAGEAA